MCFCLLLLLLLLQRQREAVRSALPTTPKQLRQLATGKRCPCSRGDNNVSPTRSTAVPCANHLHTQTQTRVSQMTDGIPHARFHAHAHWRRDHPGSPRRSPARFPQRPPSTSWSACRGTRTLSARLGVRGDDDPWALVNVERRRTGDVEVFTAPVG